MKYIQIIKVTFLILDTFTERGAFLGWNKTKTVAALYIPRTTESLCHTILKVFCAILKLAALSV